MTTEVVTGEAGSFDAEFALDSVTVGDFWVRFQLVGEEGDGSWQPSFGIGFRVADYQPNAFEVDLAVPDRIGPDEQLAAEVTGRYFFGSPIAGPKVRWTLSYGPTYFAPDGFGEFSFGDGGRPEEKALTLRGQGSEIRPELPETEGGVYGGTLTVEVTDINQQTVTEAGTFLRDSGAFYLGLQRLEQSVIGPGEPIVARAVAVRPDGSPFPGPLEVAVTAELVRFDHHTVRVLGAGSAISFQTEHTEEVVASQDGLALPVRWEDGQWILAEDAGETARFVPEEPGAYALRVTADSGGGRTTTASIGFSVSGEAVVAWDYRHPSQVDLIPDKTTYHPGETAKILVKTPFGGEARVTVERGSEILRSQRVALVGNAPVIEVPVGGGDSPNVFVSLVVIRGAGESTRMFPVPEFRYGICQLRVTDPATQLDIEVSPLADAVEPGDEVVAEVRVRDGLGAPVAGAEVTVFAVDDGVLALVGYHRPNPGATFGRPIPLTVRTGLSLFELMAEDPADLEFGNKGYLIGGGGLHGPGAKLRADFPGTALWLPSERTAGDGTLTVRFVAPDALTRYRLVAVAHAGDAAFGSGESSVAIRKKLMLLSALGQVAKVGDQIVARAVVRNESGQAGNASVSLALDSMAEAAGERTRTVALADGEAKALDFPIRLVRAGQAHWEWSAVLGDHEDAMVASLEVGYPAPLLRETYLREFEVPEGGDLLAGVNPQLLEGEGTVAVTLSNTRLANLRGAVDALLTYPYGCAEQAVSSTIPWLLADALRPILPGLDAEGSTAGAEGIDKIFALQLPSGGIGYWPGAREPGLFASAYAALAVSLVPDEQRPAGQGALLGFLSDSLRGIATTHHLSDAHPLALYALAANGRAEPAYHEILYARIDTLSRESRALLALAIAEAGGAPEAIFDLLDPRANAPGGSSWFGSPNRERALRLLAWIKVAPEDKEVARLVAELLAGRAGGAWRNTQENAWALVALTRYFTEVEGGRVTAVAGELVRDGAPPEPFSLTEQDLVADSEHGFGADNPLAALGVRGTGGGGGGPLYSEARFAVRPPVADQPRQDRGYAVSRTYQEIGDDGELHAADDLQVGDSVLVTLRVVTAQAGHFLAIDDPLPGILEAVNPDFRTAGVGGARGTAPWQADHREIRADRVVYFCDHLAPGTYTFQYLARVRTAGTVTAPSTKAEEMYRPERFGLAATQTLTAKAL
ncbi:hypothetical protein BH23VER1_BH23VER1_20380 [soil metagenome]